MPPVLREWRDTLEGKAVSLSARHPEDRLNERLVRAAREILGECGKTGRGSDASKETSDLLAEKAINRSTDGWSADDVSEAQQLVRAARGLLRIDGELTGLLWRLLVPYAEDFRERFVREGPLFFQGFFVAR